MKPLKLKYALPLLVALACGPELALAAPILGINLASFTVLGASTATNVPTSTIVGNVGVWSSDGANAITGFNSSPGVGVSDPQVTGGLVYAGGALAQSAQFQLNSVITSLGSLGPGTTLINPDLTGLTLAPGVYTVSAGTTNLSGTLTLDGGGNTNALWVFQMASTLITSPNSVVNMINAGSGAGLFWNVRTSATIDTNTTFLGNILALTSIAMNADATDFCGRALASTGAVTLNHNGLPGSCAYDVIGDGVNFETVDFSGSGLEFDNGGNVVDLTTGQVVAAFVPEPATLALTVVGLLGLALTRARRTALPAL